MRKIATLHYTSDEILHTNWIDQLIEQANTWGLDGWRIAGVTVKPNDKGGRTFRYTLSDEDPSTDEETVEETVKEFPEFTEPAPEKKGAGLVLPPSGLHLPGGIIK